MANDKRNGARGIFSGPMTWLLMVAGVLAALCIWAETRNWLYIAQGTYLGIVFLLAVAGVNLWREHMQREVRPELQALYQALCYLLLAFVIGIIAVMIVTGGTDRWQNSYVARSTGRGILFAGATFAVGVLLGFLFGFPPTPSSSTAQSGTQGSGAAPQGQTAQAGTGTGARSSTSVFENTNLREISDWLTKVIVGASLVDLFRLPPQVRKLVEYMAERPPHGAGDAPGSPAVALATLGYFAALGVLFGYVWTRFEFLSTSLPPDRDAEAFERVDRWLKLPPGPKDKDDDDRAAMTSAVKAASAGGQMRILLDTEQHRSAGTEDANARSLPVFQALVEADPEEGFHRNRGQFALALMAMKKEDAEVAKADWTRALHLLNDAIRIREQSLEPNWHQYEFARAVCRIHLDEQFKQKQKSTPEMQAAVRADLDKAKAGNVSEAQKKLIDSVDPTTNEGVTTTWGNLNP